MNCPPDVADVLIEILKWGILQTRAWAGQKDYRRCSQEADHIHNLPGLLNRYNPDLLAFYWNVERPLLIRQISFEQCKPFHEAWERLQCLVERECGASQPGSFAVPTSVASVPNVERESASPSRSLLPPRDSLSSTR